MYKIIFTLAILLLPISAISFADQEEQVITLKDGSQIKGVLSGIDNGVYTVKTPIIGDVHVAASDVSSITGASAATAAPAAGTTPMVPGSIPNLDQQIATSQKQLLSNPQSMAILQQMAQDPQVLQALQDPALVQAVANHDYQAVQNNPGVQKLINDPQMQALLQKLASQQQQNSSSQ